MNLKKISALLLSLALILGIAMPGTLAMEASQDEPATEASEPTEETSEETTEETSLSPSEPEEPSDGGEEEPTSPEEPTEAEDQPTEDAALPAPFGIASPASTLAAGDTIWIKSGSLTYKQPDATSEKRSVLFNYQTKVLSAVTDADGVLWYEFEVTGLLQMFPEYKYVPATSTTTEEPDGTEDENSCTCGEDASENLAEHDDSCPRKQYVLDLIKHEDGSYKTAAEIFGDWENYDAATRTDILNLVEAYLPTEYDFLLALTEGEESVEFVKYEGTTSKGIHAVISAPVGSFPEGTILTVADADLPTEQLTDLIPEFLGSVTVDISFGSQPGCQVVVVLNIPASEIPADANMVYIVHFGSSGAEIVTSQYLKTGTDGQSVTFGTESFSNYAAVFVNSEYSSQKLSDILSGDDRYSIRTFDVQLFDYDPEKMNTSLRSLGEYPFIFRGFNSSVADTGTNGVNNSTAEYAKQGLVQDGLSNGLPVFNYLSDGIKNGEYLFGNTALEGKTQYDAKFQFVYDNNTGYYQYKSSANHAQFNHTNNTIELYADTLSTQNQYLATLDLSAYGGAHGFQNITASKSSFKASAIATTNSTGYTRFDPYVTFAVPNAGTTEDKKGQAADDIDRIYVKAKIPASIGANQFQLFFNSGDGMNERESFKVDYTATGDWIEFVIDTSTCSAWTEGKRITEIRIDLFDSNKGNGGTLNLDASFEIEIAQISLIKDYDNYVTRGGFYPFSDIADSYPGNGSNFSYSSWKELMQNDGTRYALSSRSINNPTATATELKDDLYFGVVMEFDFYIPVDKKVNGEDLTYYFSGDDDLWVFIDGQLALDIGGGHGGISGTINLTTGSTTVDNAVTVTGYNTNDGIFEAKTSALDSALTAPGKHTMKIFYMERCGSVSNCIMKFNLPQTPQGSLSVRKNVTDESGATIDALKNETYTFTISGRFNADNGEFLDVTNLTYKLFDTSTAKTETKTVSASGTFTLTATQTATFDIDENYIITVREIAPSSAETAGYAYVSTTVNGADALEASDITRKNGEISFVFENRYKPLFGQITIIKTGISPLDHDGETEKQSSVFHVEGTSKTGIHLSMDVLIVENGSKTIVHVPVGDYTVIEVTNWTWRYGTQLPQTVTVHGDETATVTFNNNRTRQYWLSGDNYCKNDWSDWSKKKDSTADAG